MRSARTIHIVNVHAEGEVGNVITGGVLGVPGRTMADKMDHINQVDDSLRRLCTLEPRGRTQQSVNVLLAPTRPDADAGFIILQPDQAHAMSGSNCICVVTVMLETGIVPMCEPQTVIRLDMPAGLVVATASCRDGRCERVSLDMVPSFVEHLDVALEVDGIGTVMVDAAFGGCYYVLIGAAQLGLTIEPANARELCRLGTMILAAANRHIPVQHPEVLSLDHFVYAMFMDDVPDRPGELRNCTVLPPGRVDRSPCGTGSSARLATMMARGEVEVGDTIRMRSTIDSEFAAEVTGTTQIGNREAVQIRITGRGFIFGTQQISVDPADPYPLGYSLEDSGA